MFFKDFCILVLLTKVGSALEEFRVTENLPILASYLRPLQFNYLSYELFLVKKILSDSKKKEKKVTFGVLRTKVVLKFSVRLQKKKRKKCKF